MLNELEDLISAFESAQARDGQADLADFLPESSHPLYRAVLAELIRSPSSSCKWRKPTSRSRW